MLKIAAFLAALVFSTAALAQGALTPIVSSTSESSHILKASGGNLFSVYATNLTATSGFLLVLNQTTVPADGAVSPIDCIPLPAATSSSAGNASLNYVNTPAAFSAGIVAVLSSATTCFQKTTGTIVGFIKGMVNP